MNITTVSFSEKGRVAPSKLPIAQSRQTWVLAIPRLKKRNVAVTMINTRIKKEQHEKKDAAEEKLEKGKFVPVAEIDLETPE